jgi:hypothetical protein
MALNARKSIVNALKYSAHPLTLNRATLVDGTFPGPLITAQKVSFYGCKSLISIDVNDRGITLPSR